MVKKPVIRFNEYSDDWEDNKISTFCTESNILGHTGNEAKKLTVKLWGKGVVEKNEIGSENTQYYFRKTGQFIYSQLDFLNSAFAVIPEEFDGYESTHDLPAFDVNNMNPYFLFFRVIQESFYQKNGNVANGSRKAKRIYAEDFLEMKINNPQIDEQNEIASFFLYICKLINSTQEKLDKTLILKKSMLEKMFPQNDAKIPELRFKGFTGEWNKKKLSDYLDVVTEKNIYEQYGKEDVLSVSGDFGVVNQIEFQGKSLAGASLVNYGVVHTGDVVYTKSPLKEQPYGIIKTNKGKTGIVSALYGVFRKNSEINTDFIQYYFESDRRLNEYLRPLVNKGAKNTLLVSDEDSLKGIVYIPSIKEQEVIIQYFDESSKLITNYRNELAKLKIIKKSLLQKMFV